MILNILNGNFSRMDLIMLLVSIPVVLLSLSFHELSHGYIAWKLGDNTAAFHGRLTLNPLKHLDPMGALAMLIAGFGWAKPVPVNPRNFKNPKKGMALVGLAGPVSNLLLALIALLIFRVMAAFCPLNFHLKDGSLWYYVGSSFTVLDAAALFFFSFATMNVALAVFNLIPVPPFDGSRIFYFILPDKYYFSVMRYERIIMVITMLLLLTGALDTPLAFVRSHVLQLFDFVIGLVPFL